MESSNMNNLPPDDDSLDAQFRAHFSAPAIVDNGFSERVLTALHASGQKSFRFRRQFFCSAGLLAGTMIAAIGLITFKNLESALESLDRTLTVALGQLVTLPVVLAMSLAILSLAFAFRGQRLLPRL